MFAVTQLSHLVIDGELAIAAIGRAAFLLLVVWWAWIYTTWMVNWFDPRSVLVRVVLLGVALASLLMSAAIPTALTGDAVLFASAYVGLQLGRNVTTSSRNAARPIAAIASSPSITRCESCVTANA